MNIDGKVCWLFLSIVGLITMLLPQPTLAQEQQVDLTLSLVSDNYYNKVTAGKDNVFFLEIRNTGKRAITSIRLSSEKPEGWVIEFKPETIGYLGAGSVQTVDVNVRPTSATSKGEYRVTAVAEASETRKVSILRFTVETGKLVWLWVGVALVLVVVAAFVAIFLRANRQRT